jgi:lysophospholipase L1-like esterase
MELTIKDIQSIAHGAVRTEKNEAGEIALYRFTEKQMALYAHDNPDFYVKSFGTAGVRLEMDTDTDVIDLSYHTRTASSRRFYFFDVFVDGVMVQHFGHEDIKEAISTLHVELPTGTHRVCIYFPNLVAASILSLKLSDGATFTPVKRERKLLAFGDSITQGYDAKFASQSYVNLLADKLGAEVVNQGIGGEIFRPALVDAEMNYTPDIVTVAYGTNDWSGQTRERTVACANEFYANVRKAFPHAKIFAITPIWRADDHRVTKVGVFEEGRQIVRDAAAAAGATVIEGNGMIPHLPEVCSDKYLHPNDYGFKFYANALYDALIPHLEEK